MGKRQYQVIGQPVPRPDGRAMVTGGAIYTADISLPGMLWAKALRTPFPHAKITAIDVAEAEKLPGVHLVLTGADVSGVLYGWRLRDVPVLAEHEVRFVGERVAAVAATDEETARRGLHLIEVDYEELPAVFDPMDAMRDEAPLIHPHVDTYAGLPERLEGQSNVLVRRSWGHGDTTAGFEQADLLVENTYSTQRVHHGYLEPHSCVVHIDEQDRVQVWAPNKDPYILRRELAAAAGIAEERIVVNPVPIGGDFGGKGSPMDVPLCYFLALRSGRPVKMIMDYVEEFSAGCPRHASTMTLKTGVNRDGTLIAHEARYIFNTGAYGGFNPLVYLPSVYHAGGAYRIPNTHSECIQVYTNNVPGGNMRGPGEAQAVFAMESQMDAIAMRLGADPLELRLKNVAGTGELTASERRFQDFRAKEVLESAAAAADYHASRPLHVGRGIAIGDHEPGWGKTHVAVTLHADGSVVVSTPVLDQGAGTYTLLQQTVSEELGLPPGRVEVRVWNTDAVDFDMGMAASRVARIGSVAAHQAAHEVRRELGRLASESMGWPQELMEVHGDSLVRTDTGERYPWTELLARIGHSVTVRTTCDDKTPSPVTGFTAQVAEVSVDIETGQVKLLRFTTAHDVGQVINPLGHQGQINGGVVQGIGYALMEDLPVEDGNVTALTFGDYKFPNMQDIPELRTVLVESDSGVGPYAIKGIGENPIVPVAAAIANAIENAVGVRIRDLPITAEKVYRALTAKG